MTHRELNEYRRVLEAHRAELLAMLTPREEIHVQQVSDSLDQWQTAAAIDMAVSNLDRDSRRLREINTALRRIDDHSYGCCLHCEEDIGVKRLNALPWAAFCIACQQRRDQQQVRGHGPAFAYDEELSAAA